MGSNWLTLGYNDRFGEAELSGKHFTTNINWFTGDIDKEPGPENVL